MNMEKKGKLTNFITHAEKTLPAWRVNRAKQNARKEILKMKLGDLRKELGVKQIDIDGFSQSAISRLESRTDFKISTLIDYISQLDLELEITVRPRNSKKKEFVLVKA